MFFASCAEPGASCRSKALKADRPRHLLSALGGAVGARSAITVPTIRCHRRVNRQHRRRVNLPRPKNLMFEVVGAMGALGALGAGNGRDTCAWDHYTDCGALERL